MGELETTLNAMFDAMAAGDFEAVAGTMASKAQGVDEISKKWLRGPGALESYIRNTLSQVEGVSTKVSDGDETIEGDLGILTCWIEQDYTFQGQKAHVSAPTTVIFRREGDWKIALFHSIPLPEEG